MQTTAQANTPARSPALLLLPAFNQLVRGLAWVLSKFTRIHDAGVFWWPNQRRAWDAWTETSDQGGGSWTLRMGRVEVVFDYNGKANSPTA